MSDDLPNQNNNPNPWDNPGVSIPNPPAGGPNTPNSPQSPPNGNNTIDPVQSWVAQHEQRDASGRFVPSERLKTDSPNNPNLPVPILVTQNNKYSEKNDPPLVSVSVTNPITYLKLFIKRLLRNEGITIKIKPLTAIAMIIALSTAFGTGFNVAKIFFPTSSPILHRAITLQGTIEKSETGQYYLSLPDGSFWKLNLATLSNPSSISNLISKQVMIKGNLTAEPNVIEVKEVVVFTPNLPNIPNLPNSPPATNSAQPF